MVVHSGFDAQLVIKENVFHRSIYLDEAMVRRFERFFSEAFGCRLYSDRVDPSRVLGMAAMDERGLRHGS